MKPEHRVLLLRTDEAARRSAGKLTCLGYEATALPISEIVSLDNVIPAGTYDALLFSSAVAPAKMIEHQPDQAMMTLPVYCVGDRTAKVASETGYTNISTVKPDAKALADHLIRQTKYNQILYPCARHRSFDFVSALEENQITCINWEIYENKLIHPEQEELASSLLDCNIIFLYSKRVAVHFFSLVAEYELQKKLDTDTRFIAISDEVRASVPRKYRSNTYIGHDKTEQGMIERLKSL